MSNNAFIVNTESLSKSFGKNFALKNLNLHVPKGITGFVGRNGAGKTTTIGVLLGLLKPTSGKASIFGLDCWKDSYQIRSKLGVMHETNAYPGGFTAKRYLEHVARIYGISQTEEHINAQLKAVDLWNVREKPIKTYSAGMFRRLGLAQALISDPELVILDEPTANIDPLGRATILSIIKEMNKKRGTSFLISTHILSDLEKVCSWLSIIDAGAIVDQGFVDELSSKYSANTYKIVVSNPQFLVEKLKSAEFIQKVWIEKEIVYCQVKNEAAFYSEVPKIATNLKLQLKTLQHMTGTIEEIYAKTAGGS
ncbi:MAG: ABC transporter ATP-binding protein [Candidatus Bathyarchaeota archaeon]|nr:ABC transporter ATP-binding protein [Candidatus Bathyarchaeota archaeon]